MQPSHEFDEVLDILSVPIVGLRSDRTITWANRAFRALTRTSFPDPVGHDAGEVLARVMDGEVPINRCLEAATNGAPSFFVIDRLGMRAQSHPFDETESDSGTCMVLELIIKEALPLNSVDPERSNRPEAIDDELTRFAGALASLPGGSFEAELAGNTMNLSQQFFDYLEVPLAGRPAPEGHNQFLAERIHPDDIGRLISSVMTSRGTGRDQHDMRIRDWADSYRSFRVYSKILKRLSDGTPLHVIGNIIDIDADLTALAAERDRSRMLETMVGRDEHAVLLTTISGQIRSTNAAASVLFGVAADDLVGASIDDVLVLHDSTGKQMGSSVYWLSGLDERTISDATLRVGETDHRVIVEASYQRTQSGTPVGLRFAVRSSEQDLNLIDRIDRSERMRALGQLAEGVAHDFHNALAVVVAGSELALQEVRQSNVGDETRERVERNLTRVMVAAELAAARARRLLEFGRRPPSSEVCDVPPHPSIENIADLLDKGLRTAMVVNLDLQATMAVRARGKASLESVLFNLALNSAQVGSPHLAIRTGDVEVPPALAEVEGIEPGPYVKITVEDDGPGIPRSQIDKIFEPYFSARPDGHGLGLSTVYGIVTEIGGSITVESEVGEGTRFDLLLPAVPLAGETLNEPDLDLQGYSILLVDDDEPVRTLTELMLELAGSMVVSFASGQEAIDWFALSPEAVDLAIVDFHMPGMNGTQTIDQLRLTRPNLPVILITGLVKSLADHDLSSMEIQALLRKPYFRNELVAAVLASVR